MLLGSEALDAGLDQGAEVHGVFLKELAHGSLLVGANVGLILGVHGFPGLDVDLVVASEQGVVGSDESLVHVRHLFKNDYNPSNVKF